MKKSNSKTEWLEVFDSDSDFELVAPKQSKKKESLPVVKKETTKEKSGSISYTAEYILEIAKSGRAECKKCHSKIAKDELRVGVVMHGDRWVTTNWQHVQCTIFPPTMQACEALNGFCSLPEDQQRLIRERVTTSKHEIDPDEIPIDPNELVRMNWSEELEPVNELLMPLLPYQKEGLGWMVNQEKSVVRGGILADEVLVKVFARLPIHLLLSTHHCTSYSIFPSLLCIYFALSA
jgi:SNF2 family DNA or RNA helicase